MASLLDVWPPPYKLRRHPLARYVKLRPSNQHGLEITVPMRFNLRELPDIFAAHKAWILKVLARTDTQTVAPLPNHIELQAINSSWLVSYDDHAEHQRIICQPPARLILAGRYEHDGVRKAKLAAWVRSQAKKHLPLMLNQLSAETGLIYSRLSLRDQKTRWGSCTSKKSISLNYKLIFLPKFLAIHVMLHELCHTKYLNHSNQFWSLVASYDPDWQTNRRLLKRADQYIPKWLSM